MASAPREAVGKSFFAMSDGVWDTPELHKLLQEVLPRERVFERQQIDLALPGIGTRRLAITARRIDNQSGNGELVLLAIETEARMPRPARLRYAACCGSSTNCTGTTSCRSRPCSKRSRCSPPTTQSDSRHGKSRPLSGAIEGWDRLGSCGASRLITGPLQQCAGLRGCD